ncbi:MAG: LysR family transcriptional regulator ArgP [Pseudomonadota bacterium]
MKFDPAQLSAVAAILRLGSFELAAAELGVTPSAISQRIKALEEKLGTNLIIRGTPCSGTPMGTRLAKHAEDIGLLEAQLKRELSLESDGGVARIRIAINADSLATWIMSALASVDDLLFDVVIDDQDHSAEWLRNGSVSAAVTAGGNAISGCDRFELGNLPYVATASPRFISKWFPHGVTADALAVAPCLAFNAKDMLQHNWIEQETGVRLTPPTHFIPSTHGFVDAVRNGLGWALNPERLVRGPIRNNRLQRIGHTPEYQVPLDWQVSRIMGTALEPLTAAIRNAAAETLVQ